MPGAGSPDWLGDSRCWDACSRGGSSENRANGHRAHADAPHHPKRADIREEDLAPIWVGTEQQRRLQGLESADRLRASTVRSTRRRRESDDTRQTNSRSGCLRACATRNAGRRPVTGGGRRGRTSPGGGTRAAAARQLRSAQRRSARFPAGPADPRGSPTLRKSSCTAALQSTGGRLNRRNRTVTFAPRGVARDASATASRRDSTSGPDSAGLPPAAAAPVRPGADRGDRGAEPGPSSATRSEVSLMTDDSTPGHGHRRPQPAGRSGGSGRAGAACWLSKCGPWVPATATDRGRAGEAQGAGELEALPSPDRSAAPDGDPHPGRAARSGTEPETVA